MSWSSLLGKFHLSRRMRYFRPFFKLRWLPTGSSQWRNILHGYRSDCSEDPCQIWWLGQTVLEIYECLTLWRTTTIGERRRPTDDASPLNKKHKKCPEKNPKQFYIEPATGLCYNNVLVSPKNLSACFSCKISFIRKSVNADSGQ